MAEKTVAVAVAMVTHPAALAILLPLVVSTLLDALEARGVLGHLGKCDRASTASAASVGFSV